MIYNVNNLPAADNLNRFAFAIDVNKPMFIQTGKMIAYYGNLKFERVGTTLVDMLTQEALNAALYVNDFVIVTGNGKLILGDRCNDIASYDLENGNLTVKKDNLLAFESSLTCQECMLPGYLTLLGTGKLMASSNGPVHFLEAPCRIDEDALLGWADLPCPSYRYDYAYIRGFVARVGALTGVSSSGEEKQVDFTGQGTVLVQSSESPLAGRGALSAIMEKIPLLNKVEMNQLLGTVSQRYHNS